MLTIDKETLETARKNMERAREEYKNAVTDRAGALHRFIEASRAYRTVLKIVYHI